MVSVRKFVADMTSDNPLRFDYIVDYFLALFPVFTISMNFPIVGVTLSNNLRSLLGWELPEGRMSAASRQRQREMIVDWNEN